MRTRDEKEVPRHLMLRSFVDGAEGENVCEQRHLGFAPQYPSAQASLRAQVTSTSGTCAA